MQQKQRQWCTPQRVGSLHLLKQLLQPVDHCWLPLQHQCPELVQPDRDRNATIMQTAACVGGGGEGHAGLHGGHLSWVPPQRRFKAL